MTLTFERCYGVTQEEYIEKRIREMFDDLIYLDPNLAKQLLCGKQLLLNVWKQFAERELNAEQLH